MTDVVRGVEEELDGVETLEGAGVRLRRLFGNAHVPRFDPFLLLDNFGSSDPHDYVAGFPWHPHRGIETVTYMLEGRIAHGDSLGNEGVIRPGDLQWMSAGSGIIHQEMPQQREGRLEGFQLWVNLPASEKMSTPAYRGLVAKEIPTVHLDGGGSVRVIAGSHAGVDGPVQQIPIDPTYLDVSLPAGESVDVPTQRGYTALASIIDGSGSLSPGGRVHGPHRLVRFGDGDRIHLAAGDEGLRALVVSGRPLHEPVAWYGPIVMNTNDQLSEALTELRRGDFIKERRPILEE
jgi:redox-sensitive bicupin YhaK (pirin superfamily)